MLLVTIQLLELKILINGDQPQQWDQEKKHPIRIKRQANENAYFVKKK